MRRLFILLLAVTAGAANAAPEAHVWQRWTKHDQNSQKTIDHSAWTDFLEQYVVVDGPGNLNRVRYGAVTKADRKALQAYIHKLEGIDISQYTRRAQRAFWANLYNAVVVNLVLKHYPVDSIRDIADGPWEEKRVTVGGVDLSLNDIEYRILRPIWHDGLNNYAMCKATVSSPNLLTEAYTSQNIVRLLRNKAQAYVNSPRGLHFDDAGHLTVSGLYKRHMDAFGDVESGVIMHLRLYAEPALSARLDATGGIDAYAYDWSLNDAQ